MFTEEDIAVVVLAVQRIRNALDNLEKDNQESLSNYTQNCIDKDDISTLIDETLEDIIEIDGHNQKVLTRASPGAVSKILQILRKVNCFS